MEEKHYKINVLTPEFLTQHINEFIAIASDIPLESWKEENYLYELPGKWKYSLTILDKENIIVGFIIASQKKESIHIHKYAVHPQYRSKGVGLSMLQHFEKNVKAIGDCKMVSLYVDTENSNAIRFYERNGFHLREKVEGMFFFEKQLKVIVAIHQPNFLPWLGFFHKINSSDKFVILDHVTNRPNEAIYPKRVTIVCNSQEYWLTVPISKIKGQEFIPINEMRIANDGFDKKHLRTIEMNYKKSPFYKEYFYLVEQYYNHPSSLIAERNIELIKEICSILKITTPLFLSSSYQFPSASNELLVALIKEVKGSVYLHGSYAVSEKGYQDNDFFKEKAIELEAQDFKHPVYTQHNNKGNFVKGTSIIDALMNVGVEATEAFIR